MSRNNRRTVLPKAEPMLDSLKYEVAGDLGLLDDVKNKGWGNMTTHDVGKIGGNMVRTLIRRGEEALADSKDPSS